jgi:hypothetical protein
MAAQERTHSSYISRQVAADGDSSAWRLANAGVEAAGTGARGSASAGTPGALRVGAIEPSMEPGGHFVVEQWPGPGRASARHGGAQLCSLKRRATRCPIGRFTCSQPPGGGEPNVCKNVRRARALRAAPAAGSAQRSRLWAAAPLAGAAGRCATRPAPCCCASMSPVTPPPPFYPPVPPLITCPPCPLPLPCDAEAAQLTADSLPEAV